MTRESTIATLAALIALAPFLGFPYAWLMWVVPPLALVIAALALFGKKNYAASEQPPTPAFDVSHGGSDT